jgi:hypothetical protein
VQQVLTGFQSMSFVVMYKYPLGEQMFTMKSEVVGHL